MFWLCLFCLFCSQCSLPGGLTCLLPLQGSTWAVSTSQASALFSKCRSLVAPSPKWVAFIKSIPLRLRDLCGRGSSCGGQSWWMAPRKNSVFQTQRDWCTRELTGTVATCTDLHRFKPDGSQHHEKEEDTQSHLLIKKLFAMDICWPKRKKSVFSNGVSINHTPGQVPSNIKWTPCFVGQRGGAFVSFCFVWELVVLLFVLCFSVFVLYLLRERE